MLYPQSGGKPVKDFHNDLAGYASCFKVTLACLGEVGENWVLRKSRRQVTETRGSRHVPCFAFGTWQTRVPVPQLSPFFPSCVAWTSYLTYVDLCSLIFKWGQ